MDLISITSELQSASSRLSKGSKELFTLAKEFAEAERDYRKALAIEIVKLKSEGTPVTIINDVARGNMADLKYNRDVAEALYNSGKESLRAIETQVSALQSILRYQDEVTKK
jgi:hypothetical protein